MKRDVSMDLKKSVMDHKSTSLGIKKHLLSVRKDHGTDNIPRPGLRPDLIWE